MRKHLDLILAILLVASFLLASTFDHADACDRGEIPARDCR